jgi:hypothetical protein
MAPTTGRTKMATPSTNRAFLAAPVLAMIAEALAPNSS